MQRRIVNLLTLIPFCILRSPACTLQLLPSTKLGHSHHLTFTRIAPSPFAGASIRTCWR